MFGRPGSRLDWHIELFRRNNYISRSAVDRYEVSGTEGEDGVLLQCKAKEAGAGKNSNGNQPNFHRDKLHFSKISFLSQ